MKKVTILLATPSPLYAPLYIAKILKLPGFENTNFQYSLRTKFKNDVYSDDLINRLLKDGNKNEDKILALADPMRILAAKRNENVYQSPLVVGSLIKKMTYWYLDGGLFDVKPEDIKETFTKVIVHPKGMTGYAVTFYYLKKRAKLTDKEIESILFDCQIAGNEKICYDVLKYASRKTKDAEFLFSTMNPFEEFNFKNNAHAQSSMKYLDMDSVCCNAIMTALITGEKIYNKERKRINKILQSLKWAINFININEVAAAKILHKYRDSKINIAFHWDVIRVEKFINYLNQKQIYNTRLLIDEENKTNSKIIWEELYNTFGRSEHKFHSLEDIDNFFLKDQDIPDFDNERTIELNGIAKKYSEKPFVLGITDTINETIILLKITLTISFFFLAYWIGQDYYSPLTIDNNIFNETIVDDIFKESKINALIFVGLTSFGAIAFSIQIFKISIRKSFIDPFIFFGIYGFFILAVLVFCLLMFEPTLAISILLTVLGILFSITYKSIYYHFESLLLLNGAFISKLIEIYKYIISIPYRFKVYRIIRKELIKNQ